MTTYNPSDVILVKIAFSGAVDYYACSALVL
jgi:hypothetical protein